MTSEEIIKRFGKLTCRYCKINFAYNLWALDEKNGQCLNCKNHKETINGKQN